MVRLRDVQNFTNPLLQRSVHFFDLHPMPPPQRHSQLYKVMLHIQSILIILMNLTILGYDCIDHRVFVTLASAINRKH